MIAPVGVFVRFTLPVEFKEFRSLSQNKRGKHGDADGQTCRGS